MSNNKELEVYTDEELLKELRERGYKTNLKIIENRLDRLAGDCFHYRAHSLLFAEVKSIIKLIREYGKETGDTS
jgi:hypothetical protein